MLAADEGCFNIAPAPRSSISVPPKAAVGQCKSSECWLWIDAKDCVGPHSSLFHCFEETLMLLYYAGHNCLRKIFRNAQ